MHSCQTIINLFLLQLKFWPFIEYVLQYENGKIICEKMPKKRFGQKKLIKKITRFLKVNTLKLSLV